MNVREAVGAVLISEGKLLLVYKVAASDGTPIEPFWSFPLGGTDGEPHDVAVIREVKEETGLDVAPPFEKCGTLEYLLADKRTQHVTLYLAHVKGTPNIHPIDEHEISEGRWLTPQDAYELITHDIGKNVIKELFL